MWKLTDSFLFSLILLVLLPMLLSLYRGLKNERKYSKGLLSENYELAKENTELKSKHEVIMRKIYDIKEKFESHGKAIEEKIKQRGS